MAGTRKGSLWNTCFGVLLTIVPPDVARSILNIVIYFAKRSLIHLYLKHLNTTLINLSVDVVTTDGQTRLWPQWFCGPWKINNVPVMSGYLNETDSLTDHRNQNVYDETWKHRNSTRRVILKTLRPALTGALKEVCQLLNINLVVEKLKCATHFVFNNC